MNMNQKRAALDYQEEQVLKLLEVKGARLYPLPSFGEGGAMTTNYYVMAFNAETLEAFKHHVAGERVAHLYASGYIEPVWFKNELQFMLPQ